MQEFKTVEVTTDFLIEGVHFDLSYVPLKHLGYKAVMVNLSDIYAMNGKAKQIRADAKLASSPNKYELRLDRGSLHASMNPTYAGRSHTWIC